METAFLEYSLAVLISRAIPSAEDGLKPVQRRILYAMWRAGYRPDKPHRKSIAGVSETLKAFHPHGDAACYAALARMAQPFTMTVPLIDGHGNMGSLDSPPAAARYTEARLSTAAMDMLDAVNENAVAMRSNFDGTTEEPEVLPAAWPALLAEGASGIAVGTTTSIPPHNLREVIEAIKIYLTSKDCTVADLLTALPGPDFPTGGTILPFDAHSLYETGTGSFKVRGNVTVEREGRDTVLAITALPYQIGPERIIDRARKVIANGSLTSITRIDDFSDRHNGMQIRAVITAGVDPATAINDLCRLTSFEETVHVNFVALINGRPQHASLLDLVAAYADHRCDVVRRRTEFRKARAAKRLTVVEALLAALANLDDVIAIARTAKSSAAAEKAVAKLLNVSTEAAAAVLELSLRRLSTLEERRLKAEQKDLRAAIKAHQRVLSKKAALIDLVIGELDEMADKHGVDRRTALADTIPDVPTTAPTATATADTTVSLALDGTVHLGTHPRTVHTCAGAPVAICADGSVHPLDLQQLAHTPVDSSNLDAAWGPIVGVVTTDQPVMMVAENGRVKQMTGEDVRAAAESRGSSVIFPSVDVVAAFNTTEGSDVVLIAATGHALRFPAGQVRPQGARASGMAGMTADHVLAAGPADGNVVAIATKATSVSVPASDIQARNRGGAGQRLATWKPKTLAEAGWVGPAPKLLKRPLGFVQK